MSVVKPQIGISAVLVPGPDLESVVLDLAAVLGGLVGDRFEILLVCGQAPAQYADLLARAPQLPLRFVAGGSIADGCAAARYDLVFVAARDGLFDVRELNRLFEAVELGADVALGYRPRRADGIVRQLHKWGWGAGLDCALVLVRRNVWQDLPLRQHSCGAELVADAHRSGYRVAEIPVSGKRPHIAPLTTSHVATG
jgi:hypothetical protein